MNVTSGKLRELGKFASRYAAPRRVAVWLPEGYSCREKYAVLYMQDGQMLYDAEATWNKQSWGVPETAGRLMAAGRVRKFIVVGIWNTDKRYCEYFPQKPYAGLSREQKTFVGKSLKRAGACAGFFKPDSDNYLRFLVRELKPFIDKKFSVIAGAPGTFIAGSSMGALISLYAICEYPAIFGGAACLSTHWPGVPHGAANPVPGVFFEYLKRRLPPPETHKLYFDHGTRTLDAPYKIFQAQADKLVRAGGFTRVNWLTREFAGADHSEKAWSKRLHIPLSFLLGKGAGSR
ncbi:MAG: esterase [Elusimicrobia bacterium RIFOXYA2_FULL_58_8]|nr:MAG: esterase [Elusimicrobia bacterium RIFOXYA12_FULL_57_11]OGS13536.1 MAG: esterase [Elusimicrobia bacterium RIFOXYA2_FULL_58_8]